MPRPRFEIPEQELRWVAVELARRLEDLIRAVGSDLLIDRVREILRDLNEGRVGLNDPVTVNVELVVTPADIIQIASRMRSIARALPSRRPRVTPDEVEEVCRLREQGLGPSEIAKRLGIKRTRAMYIAYRYCR